RIHRRTRAHGCARRTREPARRGRRAGGRFAGATGATARHGSDGSRDPDIVDEVPILAVLASRARGATVFREVGELRVKESNRLELVAANLRAVGMTAEVQGNDLHVEGTEQTPRGK